MIKCSELCLLWTGDNSRRDSGVGSDMHPEAGGGFIDEYRNHETVVSEAI
ncbi:hypothetical protein MLPF_3388 [Mycobacterium lepromatosis]|nr:hypothetical protein MLPF_3388 [Mycobacterium lepromatosis]